MPTKEQLALFAEYDERFTAKCEAWMTANHESAQQVERTQRIALRLPKVGELGRGDRARLLHAMYEEIRQIEGWPTRRRWVNKKQGVKDDDTNADL